jgi:hypothetical protein
MTKGKRDLCQEYLDGHPGARTIPNEIVLRDSMQNWSFRWRWVLSWPKRKLSILWLRLRLVGDK